jgi:amidase
MPRMHVSSTSIIGGFVDEAESTLDRIAGPRTVGTRSRGWRRRNSASFSSMQARTAAHIAELTRSGGLTARAATEEAIARIRAAEPRLNAVSRLLADEALAEAEARDDAQSAGESPGPLHGVPVVIKEEIAVRGCVTTFGGEGNTTPAPDDAEIVKRLRAAGAVIVAKTTMPEFGAYAYTESVSRGLTHNPWDSTKTPGGSSGGTAALVAVGAIPVGIGGDGGGSIRIPSACCGLFGLKPQRGRVTTAPEPHLWWALGTTGPLSRTVMDSAIVYDVIRGSMPTDLYRAGESGSFVDAAGREPGRLRIGWSTKSSVRGIRPDPLHVEAVEDMARLLTRLGHDVREIDPEYPDATSVFLPLYLASIRSEADGVEHYERLERRTRQAYRLGTWVTRGVRERAERGVDKISVAANRVFDSIDVLLTPTVAHRPPPVGILDGRGAVSSAIRSMPMSAYTALWNVAGNPAASVPCGIADDGLPLAVQFVGRTGDETTLLSLSAQVERARPWPSTPPG